MAANAIVAVASGARFDVDSMHETAPIDVEFEVQKTRFPAPYHPAVVNSYHSPPGPTVSASQLVGRFVV